MGMPGSLPTWILLVHVAVTCAVTGLIWLVQVVNYPLFAAVGSAAFPAYHREHIRLITLVVGPLMLAEAGAAVAIVALRLCSPWLSCAGLALLVIVWGATWLLSVPQHDALAHGFSASAHEALVATNWIRTVAWTTRAGLALAMVADAMGRS
ncbi:MAG TPA: hypothetical protein VMW48_01525 [Vicinamibacterales bacterium]|nr:hypothetical protein [Vicinamibacterales bacterium]